MKLLVGLGNPGARYAGSRHNIGFEIAAAFARAHDVALADDRFHGRYGEGSLARGDGAAGGPVGVLLPATFMNASGDAVASAVDALSLDPARDVLVAYDDLDLPLGRLRLRPSGGSGGHNGVASVIDALGTEQFARLRFGIGRPPPGADAVQFVLERFTAAEQASLPEHVARAGAAAEAALREGIAVAMDRFNRPPPPRSAALLVVPEKSSWIRKIRRILSR